ncbi:hypothetical protein GH714_019309 [Hevea brasiliensis]|uniref:SHSP domain-containing protein n=1 Tax=Hevea brasiliensis TaxID=3981 RepID=A0A6A6KRA3_HEVBR|nr:hypothetical protein GH714_019309 [Hevea brasiliensis]
MVTTAKEERCHWGRGSVGGVEGTRRPPIRGGGWVWIDHRGQRGGDIEETSSLTHVNVDWRETDNAHIFRADLPGVEMQSQVWWKELASMVIEAEHRQEARLQEMLAGQEAKFQGIMDELKSLIAGLNCQDVETAERRHWDEQVPIANNNASGNSWNSFAKLEFPHFGGEGLEGWY